MFRCQRGDNTLTNICVIILYAHIHYNDVIMGAIASQITSLTIVSSIVYSDADQRKHQSSASLAFVRGIHRGPVNSPHKWPVTRKMFPFDDVIMHLKLSSFQVIRHNAHGYENWRDFTVALIGYSMRPQDCWWWFTIYVEYRGQSSVLTTVTWCW